KVFDSLIALLSILAQRARDDAIEIVWSFSQVRKKRLGFAIKNPGHHVDCRRTMKRLPARDHFIEHTAEAPDVAAVVHVESARLFRRHVMRGAHDDSGCRVDEVLSRRERIRFGVFPFASELCETKVENFNDAVAPQHDVVRLDVAMRDADGVRRVKGAGDLYAD